MHLRTKATLDELERANWFSCTGQRVEGPIVLVTSWDQAISWCSSTEWDDLLLEAANRYAEAVAKRSKARFDAWSDVAGELRSIVVPFVDAKIADTVSQQKLPKVFRDTVQWDILHLCIEAEYADVYPPGFFASQGFWYASGHFPCGWDGVFPEGKLVVF